MVFLEREDNNDDDDVADADANAAEDADDAVLEPEELRLRDALPASFQSQLAAVTAAVPPVAVRFGTFDSTRLFFTALWRRAIAFASVAPVAPVASAAGSRSDSVAGSHDVDETFFFFFFFLFFLGPVTVAVVGTSETVTGLLRSTNAAASSFTFATAAAIPTSAPPSVLALSTARNDFFPSAA